MNHEVENYLKQATSAISDPEEARLTRLELEDHILTKIEIMCLAGMNEKAASYKAISEMGSPESLAEKLGFVHSRKYPINCHILYYASEQPAATSPEHACQQLAQKLALDLDCPCHNCLQNPSLDSLDILIIVGLYNHKDTISHLYEYAKCLTKQQVRQVILITCPIRTPVIANMLTGKNIYTPTSMGLSMQLPNFSQTHLRKLLMSHEIVIIEELYCLRRFFTPGLILPKECERTLKSLHQILKNASYFRK